jgi:hypothetical protein
VWTATGTDELLVETFPGSGVLSNDYPGGAGSYESYGYYRYGFNGKENDNEIKGVAISRIMACGFMILNWEDF